MSEKPSGMVSCENCGRDRHYMSTFSALNFGMKRVCTSCVARFLDSGEWDTTELDD